MVETRLGCCLPEVVESRQGRCWLGSRKGGNLYQVGNTDHQSCWGAVVELKLGHC